MWEGQQNNIKLTECRTCEHFCYNQELAGERFISHIQNLDASQSHLDCRSYSCHQKLLSKWHGTNHMIRWMEWWCTHLMVKLGNTLAMCIFSFQWRQGTLVLGYVYTNSIHSSYLLLFILVGRWYSRLQLATVYVFIYGHTRRIVWIGI